MISWSFSKLSDFTRCRLAFKIKHLDKVPEPERPLKPGQLEHANDRGSRVHDNCEGYVRSDHNSLCPEAEKHFGLQIDLLRILYAFGQVELEGNWGMDIGWATAEWDEAWLRLKLDVLVHISKTEATVIDYKTGRKFGNEVKHAQQLQLYALVTFLRYPQLETVCAELWYIDQGETTRQMFTRAQGLRFKRGFDKQGNDITSCTDFRANPNKFSCQWCPWKDTGHCTVGVHKGG